MAEKSEKNSFMDVLSGNAAVKAEKASNPSLFSNNKKPTDRSKLSAKITPEGSEALLIFKKRNPTPKAGGGFDLSDTDLLKQFNALSTVTKGDVEALAVVSTSPDVLAVPFNKYAANFAVFEGKWGFEKARGVITRNPALFSIPTTGYGSCEVAGDDVVVLSYVINATRPIGGILLTALFLALLKPVIVTLIPF
eukprot:CAMPEP_0119038456 /NCGR_PEP_ID=MMETSP1177-20130426/7416_1 /TAXON_ID=2985 /ORGANISM="Ochromonas sp, Strain CCMP1899" /LENGTH=193 /DNA_ID=CAMNT_0007001093 /DNA_START=211 /DNA_END=792 /DNA_ORIENTATION=-